MSQRSRAQIDAAIRRFEEYLEARERNPGLSPEAMLEQNPELREILVSMLEGHRELEASCQSLRRPLKGFGSVVPLPSGARPPRRRRIATGLVAATLVAALSILFWPGKRVHEEPSPNQVALVSEFLESQWHVVERVAAGTAPRRETEFAQQLVNLQEALQREHLPAEALDPGLDRQLDRSGPPQGEVSPTAPVTPPSSTPSETSVMALSFADFLHAKGNASSTSPRSELREPTLAALYQSASQLHELPLRVIDLDADKADASDWEVFAQPVRLDSGRILPPRYLGRDDEPLWLTAGDWRLVVQHPATRRHSTLRLLVLPDRAILPQVAFLRSEREVTKSMVEVPESRILYGASFTPSFHHGEAEEDVSLFFLDPTETTNEQYQRFYDEAIRYGWFGKQDLWPTGWNENPPESSTRQLAVSGLSWTQASRYANWSGKRLPTDREWERAAQGSATENRVYPWGNHFSRDAVDSTQYRSPASVNVGQGEAGWVADPDRRSGAALVEGQAVMRLADNVREWVEDLTAYPNRDGQIQFGLDVRSLRRTLRGSSWMHVNELNCRIDQRTSALPDYPQPDFGVRGAKSPYPGWTPDRTR